MRDPQSPQLHLKICHPSLQNQVFALELKNFALKIGHLPLNLLDIPVLEKEPESCRDRIRRIVVLAALNCVIQKNLNVNRQFIGGWLFAQTLRGNHTSNLGRNLI